MKSDRILFAGMHESGKTTFIAALWDYINSDRSDRKITLNSLANSENQYLEKIRGEWLQCKKVSRTNLNESETVKMDVKIGADYIVLEIPDISGELFNTHFQLREWEVDYDNLVKQMCGILLFINPKDKRNRTQYIADAMAIEAEIEGMSARNNDSGVAGEGLTEEKAENFTPMDFLSWSEEYTSNQVKLVDILQLIGSRVTIESPLRISVVISKWDLLEVNIGGSPESWLRLNMPLLHQFLTCNSDIFQLEVFGVSAQGGDYGNTEKRNRLLALDPYARPLVKHRDVFINDITAPITWLTEN